MLPQESFDPLKNAFGVTFPADETAVTLTASKHSAGIWGDVNNPNWVGKKALITYKGSATGPTVEQVFYDKPSDGSGGYVEEPEFEISIPVEPINGVTINYCSVFMPITDTETQYVKPYNIYMTRAST